MNDIFKPSTNFIYLKFWDPASAEQLESSKPFADLWPTLPPRYRDAPEEPFVFINYKITPAWIMPPPCRGYGRALRDRCAQKCAPDSLLSVVAASVLPDLLCRQPLVQGLRPSVCSAACSSSVSLLYPVCSSNSIDIFAGFFAGRLC